MGYTTDFEGSMKVEPPLSAEEVSYINKFADSRRMHRKSSPYFVDGSGFKGQAGEDDVLAPNSPDPSQPGLWCQWIASEDGTEIEWDGGEKFYDADDWMIYLIEHFIGANPKAQSELPFFTGHTCNGNIFASGEESDDHWMMEIKDNVLTVKQGNVVYE